MIARIMISGREATPARVFERAAWIVLGGAVALMLVFALGSSVFVLPGADDWCFGANPISPIRRANELYQIWSGRWLSMVSLAVVTRAVDLTGKGYPIAAVLLSFPLWLGAFYLIVKQAVQGWKHSLLWALLLLTIFYAGSPRPMEVFYWLPGIVVYAPPFALTAASLFLARRRWIILSALCAFAAALFNELAVIVALPFLALLAFHDRRLVWAVAALLAGFLIVALAPGNGVRLNVLERPSIAWVAWSVARPYLSPIALLADARLWALVALVLALPGDRATLPPRWYLLPLCALLGIFTSAVAVTWAASTTLEPRVLAYMFAVILSTAFVTAYHLRGIVSSSVVRCGALAFLAISIVTSPNVQDIVQVLPESLATRAKAEAYFTAIRAQRGRDVVAAPLGQLAYMGVYQPYEDPKYPTNVCMASYLGLRSIRSAANLRQ